MDGTEKRALNTRPKLRFVGRNTGVRYEISLAASAF